MLSNSAHRAAFVRRMKETGGGTRRRRSGRKMRRNVRPQTAAERRSYAAGHERIFGKAKRRRSSKPKAAKRHAAPKRHRASKSVKAARARHQEGAEEARCGTG